MVSSDISNTNVVRKFIDHQWEYKPQNTDLEPITYVVYVICPSSTLQYERICERCLRHEYYSQTQTYEAVKKGKIKFELLKEKIEKEKSNE